MSAGVAKSVEELDPRMVAHFWSKVDRSGDCWVWIGGYFNTGYGAFYVRNETRTVAKRAHRVAYTIAFGLIPGGILIDHMCHNKSCVKPDHLRAVTHQQNQENRQGAPSSSTSGIRGVSWIAFHQRWRASAKSGGKEYYGGQFKTKEEAAEAVKALRLRLHTHNDSDRT